MPLKQPTLDDRTYADLVQEGIGLIPVHAPEWTNYNVADPGITLIELFAYFAEILLYRSDRVSDRAKAQFAELLSGQECSQTGEILDSSIREAVAIIRKRFRAVSSEDFEQLTYELTKEFPLLFQEGVGGGNKDEAGERVVGRARCFSRRNLEATAAAERERDQPGHISIVFVPGNPWLPVESVAAIGTRLRAALEPRRLLTSRVHVIGPSYVEIGFRIKVALSRAAQNEIEYRITAELERFFDPLRGGPKRSGWPFGRSVYVSDVDQLLAALDGVDHVAAVEFEVGDSTRLNRSNRLNRLHRNEAGEITGVRLNAEELVRVLTVQVAKTYVEGTR